MEGHIFNIQKYCIHDGPGIRTAVFMKGCTLRCFWCHNPESLRVKPQLQLLLDHCIGCGQCFEACPTGAHQIGENGAHEFVRELCSGCGNCADVCYAEALVLRGKTVSVEEVIDEVEKDRSFYESSGGGVTFSGGEPLMQKDFLEAMLRESKKRGLHTAIETAGHVPKETVEAVMPFVDLWMYDVKTFDEAKHKEVTGASNRQIHDNLKFLADSGADITVRIPVVPGVNNNREELGNIASFVKGLGLPYVELLPFHQMSSGKYDTLGMDYEARDLEAPERAYLEGFTDLFTDIGLKVKVM